MAPNNIIPHFDDTIFTAPEVLEHVKTITTAAKPLPHRLILDKLLTRIEEIDFRALGNIPEGEKLKGREQHVLIIDEIFNRAILNHWGICRKQGFIYLFNGAYWREVDDAELQDFMGMAAEKMGINRLAAKHYTYKEHLYKQFISAGHLQKAESDNQAVLVPLQNGTFEVTGQGSQLREFRREDFLTFQLPFDYNSNADAPIFRQYLDQVLPDIQCQSVLAEYLGYVFMPFQALKLEKVLLLYGTGANGKSVFFEIINALVGQECLSTYSLQSLTDSTGYFRAKLGDKLVNYASEINGKLEASLFKQMASGEPVEARLPYGEPFTLRQYAKLIFNCNELPREVEHTNAFFRRFLIIPFKVTIPEAEQDKDLSRKIIEQELSGVFNWIMAGLDRLLNQRRFSECNAAQLETERYKKSSDSVQMFLEEEEDIASALKHRMLKDLYEEYRRFCHEGGYQPLNKQNFRKRLEGINIGIEKEEQGKCGVCRKAGANLKGFFRRHLFHFFHFPSVSRENGEKSEPLKNTYKNGPGIT